MIEEGSIDKEGVIPIYHQLKKIIIQQIEKGEWKVNELIPSERELTDHLAISRMTVRHAINDLVSEGVLYRKRGKGTYVARPKINQGLTKLSSFTEDMEKRGLKPRSKVLHIEEIEADKEVAEKLNLKEGDRVVEVFRLRLADEQPMALERSFLPADKVSSLKSLSLENKSLYKELQEKYHLNLASATQTIEISYPVNPSDARYLEIDLDTPVLLIERRTYSEDDTPLEYVQSFYRADRYKFSIEMDK
ncbi:GntR family transcriptional regulator [Salimicrobium halophilum]|uniref:Transcriptional regulator, GntR family n=1 Tax=Salimicrobium halophilum TaxID=86666 RepID=A0A1G8SAX7_9BACI|nr:GntR family transcriptional regulator [Salimicrobium halophilum]SDJ26351.1 transcriptional regulator, GntR family [Salimicrobium halophilum]